MPVLSSYQNFAWEGSHLLPTLLLFTVISFPWQHVPQKERQIKLNKFKPTCKITSFTVLFEKLTTFSNLTSRDSVGPRNIGKQEQLLPGYTTLIPNFVWLGKKMLNVATFSLVKKNCRWSRIEHCPFWALSQDDLVGKEGAYIWRENEEMFLWQVDLKAWQLSETAEGDGVVQWILGERGYWARNADTHGHVINGKAREKCTYTHFRSFGSLYILGHDLFFCSLICLK